MLSLDQTGRKTGTEPEPVPGPKPICANWFVAITKRLRRSITSKRADPFRGCRQYRLFCSLAYGVYICLVVIDKAGQFPWIIGYCWLKSGTCRMHKAWIIGVSGLHEFCTNIFDMHISSLAHILFCGYPQVYPHRARAVWWASVSNAEPLSH